MQDSTSQAILARFKGVVKTRRAKRVPRKKSLPRIVSVEGQLERGSKTSFSVKGVDINVSDHTWMIGELELGRKAVVQGKFDENKVLSALRIILK